MYEFVIQCDGLGIKVLDLAGYWLLYIISILHNVDEFLLDYLLNTTFRTFCFLSVVKFQVSTRFLSFW